MNAPPDEFRKYLIGVHAVRGPDIPERPNHAVFTDACRQDGLTDAARGIFDKHSFTSHAPMTFEHRCSSWLGFSFAQAIDKRHEDLYIARDIAARTQAAFVQVQGERQKNESDLQEVEDQIVRAKALLDDPHSQFYQPLTDALTTPHHESKSFKSRPENSTPWYQSVADVAAWVGTRPWKKFLLWLALVTGEIFLIFSITQRLGDSEQIGQMLALSLAAMAVAVAWLAVPPLLEHGTSRGRKVVSWLAITLYVLTMLALGWVRYLTTRPRVFTLVEDATDAGEMQPYGDALLYLLWVALPLGLTAVIALLETHHSSDRRDDPLLASRPTAVKAAGDRRQQRQQKNLISHLADLRMLKQHLMERHTFLKAEEAHAWSAQEDVHLNESAIDERTRIHLQSLPELISDGFLCYLKGLEQGLSDPTMTAYIQESAQTFLPRYMETAETKINDYLVYIDEHPLPSPHRASAETAV